MPSVKITIRNLFGTREVSLDGLSTLDLLPEALSLTIADSRTGLTARPQAVRRIIAQLTALLPPIPQPAPVTVGCIADECGRSMVPLCAEHRDEASRTIVAIAVDGAASEASA